MTALVPDSPRDRSRASFELAFGALFWLAFLLALEPGNLVRAARAGIEPSWSAEALRIAGASLLAAPSCPLIFWLVRRLPVRGPRRGARAATHLAAIVGLALTLIMIGGGLGSLLPPTSISTRLADQLAGNILLLVAAMTVLDVGAHLASRKDEAPPKAAYLDRILVPGRGRSVIVEAGRIDWIEAQGNYLSLHADAQAHLLRETLGGLLSQLNPEVFVRVHRRTIVNIDRVRELVRLGNGDAMARLHDGSELRVSRGFGEELRRRLQGRSTCA